MTFRLVLSLSLLAALALAPAGRLHAATEIGEAVSVSATVESIDMKTRTVELKDADGKTASVVVPAEIANLEKLKVGDTVNLTYAISVATQLLKPGEQPAMTDVAAVKRGAGEIVSAESTSAILKVNAVDVAQNRVTLTGPKGNTRTVQVKAPELQAKLKDLKPGDDVQVTFTEAVAIKVEPKAK